MKTALIIESDPRFSGDISSALVAIDPKLKLEKLSGMNEFIAWVKAQIARPVELRKTDPTLVSLMVLDADFYQGKNLVEFQTQLGLLSKNEFLLNNDPPILLLTSFEGIESSIEKFETKEISNILIKPFDKPILEQHLKIAITGNSAVKDSTVFRQQLKSKIEMIKEVSLINIHELGFETLSNRKIEVGRVAKYYSHWFKDGNTEGVFARCVSCVQSKSDPDKFETKFTFFGLSSAQFQNLRRALYKAPAHHAVKAEAIISGGNSEKSGVVLLGSTLNEVRDSLAAKFQNVEFVSFQTKEELFGYADKSLVKSSIVPDKSLFKKANPLKIYIGKSGGIVGFEVEKMPENHLFGFSDEAVVKDKQFLVNCSHFQDRELLSKLLGGAAFQPGAPANKVFFKNSDGQFHAYEILTVQVVNHKIFGSTLEFAIKELLQSESDVLFLNRSNSSFPINFVMISEQFFNSDESESWSKAILGIKNQNAKNGGGPPALLVAYRNCPNDSYLRQIKDLVSDLILSPFERVYLLKRIKKMGPNLIEKDEALENQIVEHVEKISVGNEVDVISVSEAAIVMKYYRPITFGSYRLFRVKSASDSEDKIYIGRCFYSEDDKKGQFDNHFVFFGMSDQYLKNIRKWIKENYIMTKQGPG